MKHARPLAGKLVGIYNGVPVYAAAGLGETYDIATNIPLYPVLTLDVPVAQITNDFLSEVRSQVAAKLKEEWPTVALVAVATGLAVYGVTRAACR